MTAPVRIEAKAWSDPRYATLARLLGYSDPDFALIKCARIWSWQTEEYTAERPTYVVDADTIIAILGESGPAALVRAKLADETPEGYRIRGSEGRIEWCEELTAKRQRAGQARAAKAKRDSAGRLLSENFSNEDYCDPAHAGCAGPAPASTTSSTPPAQSSAPSPSPDQREEREPAQAPAPLALVAAEPRQRRTRARQQRPHTTIPDSWEPRQQELDKAAELGLDPSREATRFRDHHTAKGTTYADWDAGFRTWLGKGAEFAAQRSGGSGYASRPERPNPMRPM